jgi:hypothetical protein
VVFGQGSAQIEWHCQIDSDSNRFLLRLDREEVASVVQTPGSIRVVVVNSNL